MQKNRVSPTHAYNYWRKVFVSLSKDTLTNRDFDEWFWKNTTPQVQALGYFGTANIEGQGEAEYFVDLVRRSFVSMLEACAKGDLA